MLKNKTNKDDRTISAYRQQGFTIIEVLIVLAIAGLILLIVFLAVPALQRNARNTTIKNDAQALAGGFSEYASNNDGNFPASIAQSGSDVTIGAGTSNQAVAKVSANTAVTTTKVSGPPTSYTPGTLWWATGIDCSGNTSARALSVYYYVEASGSNHTPSCVSGS